MLALHTPKQNHLPAALRVAEYERRLPHLEQVPLQSGQAPCHAGVRHDGMIEGAGRLQVRALLHCGGEKITVPDGAKRAARVCGCDAVIGRKFDCLLSRKAAIVDPFFL
jgi:hypothetical protein